MGDLSRDFSRSEFACRCGCGFDTVDAGLLKALESVRRQFDASVTVNSGCRCPSHNKKVGGSPGSQHLFGRAADIRVEGVKPATVYAYLNGLYSDEYGLGSYETFTHIDTRSNGPARW